MNRNEEYAEFNNEFKESLKNIIPLLNDCFELSIYSSIDSENWKIEMGNDCDEHPTFVEISTKNAIPDSRSNEWFSPKNLLFRLHKIKEFPNFFNDTEKNFLKELLTKFLKSILLQFTNCKIIEDLNNHNIIKYVLKHVKDSNSFFNDYVNQKLIEKSLLPVVIINQLSTQMYEKRPIHGSIIFVKNNKILKHLDGVLDLSEINSSQRTISVDNMKGVRKLLEMTTPDTCLVATTNNHEIIALACIDTILNYCENSCLKFEGHSKWRINLNRKDWISYTNGIYHLCMDEVIQESYEKQLQTLQLDDKDYSTIRNIVKLLIKEEHGTSIIFMDKSVISGEIKKFHETNRCFKLNNSGIDLFNYLQKMKGITSIDGALLADTDGRCYALSVILDGEAVQKGNTSRGSRYNSILNYIYLKHKQFRGVPIFGVIVSEDGNIDVINPVQEKQQSKKE